MLKLDSGVCKRGRERSVWWRGTNACVVPSHILLKTVFPKGRRWGSNRGREGWRDGERKGVTNDHLRKCKTFWKTKRKRKMRTRKGRKESEGHEENNKEEEEENNKYKR